MSRPPMLSTVTSVGSKSTTRDGATSTSGRPHRGTKSDHRRYGRRRDRGPIATHEVSGGDGIRLHACEWGNPQGPSILFIHGWSQSQLCWSRQVSSDLADRFHIVTFDNRGHGISEKPLLGDRYTNRDFGPMTSQRSSIEPVWTDAVLVAWSYGGLRCQRLRAGVRDGRGRRNQPRGRHGDVEAPDLRPSRRGSSRERRGCVFVRSEDEHRRHPPLLARGHGAAAPARRLGHNVVREHGRTTGGTTAR